MSANNFMVSLTIIMVMVIAFSGCSKEPEISVTIIPEWGGTVKKEIHNGEVILSATPAASHRFLYWRRPGTTMYWYTRTITLPHRDQQIEVYFVQHTTTGIEFKEGL